MRRPKFTIAGILGFVVFLAVGLAALRESTDAWDSGVFGATLLWLTVAGLLVVYRRDRKRAFWIGFTLFGWVYLGASLVPPVRSRLPTTMVLNDLASNRPGGNWTSTVLFRWPPSGDLAFPISAQPVVAGLATVGSPNWAYTWMPTAAVPTGTARAGNFLRIGHSLLALIAGILGGALSRRLHDKNRRDGRNASPIATAEPTTRS